MNETKALARALRKHPRGCWKQCRTDLEAESANVRETQ